MVGNVTLTLGNADSASVARWLEDRTDVASGLCAQLVDAIGFYERERERSCALTLFEVETARVHSIAIAYLADHPGEECVGILAAPESARDGRRGVIA